MDKKNVTSESPANEDVVNEMDDAELKRTTGGLTVAPISLLRPTLIKSSLSRPVLTLPTSQLDITRIFLGQEAHRS